nr:protein main-like 2 [Quercus suber]
MAAANAARINHAEPGPIDRLVLTQQPNHRSEAIWNGQDPGTLTCHSRSSEFSNREPMVDDRVVNIIKALGLEGLLWIPGHGIETKGNDAARLAASCEPSTKSSPQVPRKH